MKQLAEILDHILDSAPATFTAPQLRVLIRALIHIDSYHFADDVAVHFVRDDENNQQTGEEVLLSVVDGLEDDKLSGSPSPATRIFPARTRSTIWPRLKLSSLNRSPKRLRRRRPHPRRPRQSRPKPQGRRPPRNSQPNPQKGPAMAPLLHPEETMLQFTHKLKLTRAGQGQVQSPSPLQPRERWPRRYPWRLLYLFLALRPAPGPHRPRRRTARVCSQSRSVGAATRTPPEESRRRNRGTSLASLELS
jgi:hypothetical protein